ncbi:MAG: KEOPS complex subunit Cgi121 [Promethearchaeota archaeon]
MVDQFFPIPPEWSGWSGCLSHLFPNNVDSKGKINFFIELKDQLWAEFGVAFQIFNPDALFSQNHLKFIIHHVFHTFQTKTNIAQQPAMEFLLYLSQHRQIQKAIEDVGVQFPDKNDKPANLGLTLFGPSESLSKAFQHLKTQLGTSPLDMFPFPKSANYLQFMQKFEISVPQLVTTLQGDGQPVPEDLTSYTQLHQALPHSTLQHAIEDLINLGMVKLYTQNFKFR